MNTTDTKQIAIYKTKKEWAIIDKKIKSITKQRLPDKKRLSEYIRAEINKLRDDFVECPDCIEEKAGKRITKRPRIPIHDLDKLNNIAMIFEIPINDLIERLIIDPLLREKPFDFPNLP